MLTGSMHHGGPTELQGFKWQILQCGGECTQHHLQLEVHMHMLSRAPFKVDGMYLFMHGCTCRTRQRRTSGSFAPPTPSLRQLPVLFSAAYLRRAGPWVSGHFSVLVSHRHAGITAAFVQFMAAICILGIWIQVLESPRQALHPLGHSTGHFVTLCHCSPEN